MMHLEHISLLLAAALVLSPGCGEHEDDTPVDGPVMPVVTGAITLTASDAPVLTDAGGTASVTFKATLDWTASSSADWLTVSPASGAAGETLTVTLTAEANETYDERSAVLTLACGKDAKSVTVTQKQKDGFVMSPQTVTVPQEGATLEIRLMTNVEVTAAADADWMSVVRTKGLIEEVYTVEVAANESFDPRFGHIVFSSAAGSETINIEQDALETPPDVPPFENEENADLECPDPPTVGTVGLGDQTGYGAGVTGGSAATEENILHFDTGKALQTWLLARTKSEKKGDHTPVTIWLSGTFKPDDGRDFSEDHPWFDVKDVSNLSFIGTDSFVMDRIGLFCVRANNIIIRNINFLQPKANNGADAVSMQKCDGVWVDHCTFTSLNQTKDYEDGSCDITHASKNVTVSWCHFIKTQKSCLVGHSNSATDDVAITATFHHNWFEASSSRHPRVRFGTVHVYNNFFDRNTTYGVGSAYGARVLVEYNFFDSVQLPTDICTYPAKDGDVSNLQGSVAGYLYPTENAYANRPAKAKDPYPLSNVQYAKYGGEAGTPLTYSDFKPPYDYVVSPAETVPGLVWDGSGHGKLGLREAPVAVNNGGITDFDAQN